MKILVINGPNLQLLGRRDKKFYGTHTLPEIEHSLSAAALSLGVSVDFFQTNHEGAIVDRIAEAIDCYDGIVLNPAAYTHTSIAIRDAIEASRLPVVEVHLSNISGRDEFRKVSMTGPVCIGQMTGFGADTYEWALRALARYIENNQ